MSVEAAPEYAGFDRPVVDADTVDWWQAVGQGRLLLEHCEACGHHGFYPRSFCSVCWSPDVELVPAQGLGTVYTFSVVRANDLPPFNERLPYVVAMVDLDEGPRIMTSLAQVEPDQVEIGLRVTFRPRTVATGFVVPEFVPLSATDA